MNESVIREMTRVARESGAINLAQGFPDFPPVDAVIKAAEKAIRADFNQYPITWGAAEFREAIAGYYQHWHSMEVSPETELTVCCGSTEAMLSTMLALVNPGERVIIFEPYYENYLPDSILSGAEASYVRLLYEDGEWRIPWEVLEKAAAPGFAAMIINTPNNPAGKVFTEDELTRIGELCEKHDAVLISDEIYDHITFDGRSHLPPASLPGLRQRTVTINSLSKTFAVTGWRVGWAMAPEELTAAIRKVHDFATVGAPHPFQIAGAEMLRFGDDYFNGLGEFYQNRRDYLAEGLKQAGFKPRIPQGAYYMLAEYEDDGKAVTDMDYCIELTRSAGVATVPGSSFFATHGAKTGLIRFCFGKNFETLEAVTDRLRSRGNA